MQEDMAADNQNLFDYSQMDPSMMMLQNNMDMSGMPLAPNENDINADLANVFGSTNPLLIS